MDGVQECVCLVIMAVPDLMCSSILYTIRYYILSSMRSSVQGIQRCTASSTPTAIVPAPINVFVQMLSLRIELRAASKNATLSLTSIKAVTGVQNAATLDFLVRLVVRDPGEHHSTTSSQVFQGAAPILHSIPSRCRARSLTRLCNVSHFFKIGMLSSDFVI